MAVKSRATILSEAAANITDALGGQNSAADVRTRIEDLADSAVIQEAWANVASAATCDLGAVSPNFVNITGTTTITGFGTVTAGVLRYGKFAGILTLTHNATSLILPGGANITTAAGDRFLAVSEGAGNWRVLFYVKASGKAIVAPAHTEITGTTASGQTLMAFAGQIPFPATENASADPNTLDDYEEGTFTPTISFGGASVGITYTFQDGYYTKIGRQIGINVTVVMSNNGSSAGNMSIQTLPFSSLLQCAAAVRAQSLAAGVGTAGISALISTVEMVISKQAGGTVTLLADTDTGNTSGFRTAGIYFV